MPDADFAAANKRVLAKKAAFSAAMAVQYDRRICRVVISLESGLAIAFAPRDVQGLENAQPVQPGSEQLRWV